jgi:AmmeMemoRadiSam system protein B
MTPQLRPKLRWPLEIKRERFDNREILLFTCPLGVAPEPLALIAEVGPIVAQLDGTKSYQELLEYFEPRGVAPTVMEQLITLLDSKLFLDSPTFQTSFQGVKDSYAAQKVREAALAGRSYSDEKIILEKEIDIFLTNSSSEVDLRPGSSLLGVMSPHIDYHRGGPTYGGTYRQLKGADHTRYLLIGTSHKYSETLFQLTDKPFATPLGVINTDKNFVASLAKKFGPSRSFSDEYLHRNEHSLELQLPFFQRVIDHQAEIIPVLVGSLFDSVTSGRYPEELEEYNSFVSALSECVTESKNNGEKLAIIAGVDMAHIGQFFGDKEPLTPLKLLEIAAQDQEYLDSIISLDKHKLFAHIAKDQDARRICGFPTMYLILDLFERQNLKPQCKLYRYEQAYNKANDCCVTFAGMGFYNY